MKYAHCWDFYFLFYHIQSSVLWFLNSYVHIPGEIAMRRSSGSWKTGLQASPQVGLLTIALGHHKKVVLMIYVVCITY